MAIWWPCILLLWTALVIVYLNWTKQNTEYRLYILCKVPYIIGGQGCHLSIKYSESLILYVFPNLKLFGFIKLRRYKKHTTISKIQFTEILKLVMTCLVFLSIQMYNVYSLQKWHVLHHRKYKVIFFKRWPS